MARNSADVVDHEVDAKLSAGDHGSDEAEALAAINASWFDDSERTDVLEPRHLLAQLAAAPRERESGQRPIVLSPDLPPRAAEDPKWNDEHEESYAAAVDRLGPWEEPDLTDSAEWEEAQTAYFERTANFELLDAQFVSEYTDRLPGGLRELVSTDAESAATERQKPQRRSGVRESARALPNPSPLDESQTASDLEDREQSVHFAYEVAPSARDASKRSVPAAAPAAAAPASKLWKPSKVTRSSRSPVANASAAKRRAGSETIRNRGRAASARSESIPSDPVAFDADALQFDEASVATARGGRRFEPTLERPAQATAELQRKAAAMEASRRPVRRTSPRSSVPAPAPEQPAQLAALPMTAGFDSDIAELRKHRRDQAAAWVWLGASALAGVALILVVRAWTNSSVPVVESTAQEPSVAVETTVNAAAAHPAETGFAITSRPEGAQIYVDGKSTGFITPARVWRLTPGLHSVELKLDGYYDTSLPAVLKENTTLELASVEMRAHAAVAEPAAAPVGAIIPQLVAAAVRGHLRRGEGRRWHRRGISRNATLRGLNDDESVQTVTADGQGTLRINSRPWARVMVDNKFVGNTPQRGLRIASGEHSVKLVNEPLNMSKTIHVTIHDGETVTRVEMLNEDAEQSHVSRSTTRDAFAKADRSNR